MKTYKLLFFILLNISFINYSNGQYCDPSTTGGYTSCIYNGGITNFSFAGINNNSNSCDNSGTVGYTYFSSLTAASVTVSSSYSVSVTMIDPSANSTAGVWIDFNRNNVFDSSEFFSLGTNLSAVSSYTFNGIIAVPTNASLGETRMRVRTRRGSGVFDSSAACGVTPSPNRGEIEDYKVSIVSNTPCSGIPTPGNTVSTNAYACSGASFVLSLQNTVIGSGISYQWQSSTDGFANWANISGAISATHTRTQTQTTYYRCLVDCSGNTGISSPIQISSEAASLPFNERFNTPLSRPGCWSEQITSGIDNTTHIQYVASSTSPTANPAEGSGMVKYNTYSINSGVQKRLQSPPISTVSMENIKLSYKWYHNTTGPSWNDRMQVQYSLNGTTWTNVGVEILRYGNATGWYLKELELPNIVEGVSQIYLGFLFISANGYNMYLDDVKVSGDFVCQAEIESVSDGSGCGSIELSAVTNDGNGYDINWYSNETSNDIIHTGSIFMTDMTNTTTFYVAASTGSCESSRVPVIATILAAPILNSHHPVSVCFPNTVDITSPDITAGSAGEGILSYWIDENATVALINPEAISVSGTYFIQSSVGTCSDIQPVLVSIAYCGPVPSNDNPAVNNPALNSTAYVYPNIYNIQGTTQGATINTATGSRDVWYQFRAITNGVRITIGSSIIDAKVYLFEAGNLIEPLDVEDVVSGIGTEYLNYGNLTPGNNYRIAISSANSTDGAFNICLQHLLKPTCGANQPLSLCSSVSIGIKGANLATAAFFDNQNQSHSLMTTGLISLGSSALQLGYGNTYTLNLTGHFVLVNGAGVSEVIHVANENACQLTISEQPLLEVKNNQRALNGATLFRSSYLTASALGANYLCGVRGYYIEFTQVSDKYGNNPQSLGAFRKAILSITPSISLSYAFNQIPVVSASAIGYWSVRWKPIFTDNSEGIYGLPHVIAVLSTAFGSMNAPISSPSEVISHQGRALSALVYPNPNNGYNLNLNMNNNNTEVDKIELRIIDGMGRMVYSNSFLVIGDNMNATLSFETPLSNGLYIMEFRTGDQVVQQKLMVNR